MAATCAKYAHAAFMSCTNPRHPSRGRMIVPNNQGLLQDTFELILKTQTRIRPAKKGLLPTGKLTWNLNKGHSSIFISTLLIIHLGIPFLYTVFGYIYIYYIYAHLECILSTLSRECNPRGLYITSTPTQVNNFKLASWSDWEHMIRSLWQFDTHQTAL